MVVRIKTYEHMESGTMAGRVGAIAVASILLGNVYLTLDEKEGIRLLGSLLRKLNTW